MFREYKKFIRIIPLNRFKLYIFYFFWISFWLSIGTSITIGQGLSYDYLTFKNFFNFLRQNTILFIFFFLLILSIKKKLTTLLLLLAYPISSYIGSLLNINNNESHIFYLNYFISISTIIIFTHNFIADKKFTSENTCTLIKISLIILLSFFTIILIPEIIIKSSNDVVNLRGFDDKSIKLGQEIFLYIPQNSNGASRIVLILILFILVKSNYTKEKIKIIINYSLVLLLGVIVYFYQSKINILFYFLFTIIIISKNNFLKKKEKFFFILISLITPILIYNSSLEFSKSNDRIFDSIKNNDRIFDSIKNIYELRDLKFNNIENDNYRELSEQCILYQTPVDKLSGGRFCGWIIIIKNISINKIIFGYGFFEDQKLLKFYEKVSSNSYIFLLYNSGVLGVGSYILFLTIFFKKDFAKYILIKKNLCQEFALSLIIFLFIRSLFEDSIVFLSIDLLLIMNCIMIIKKTKFYTKKTLF
jgi:hypothetical protein